MTNRNERLMVERIDRDAAWSAERGRINAEAEEHISAFMSAFTGSSRAATRFAAEAGRAEVLPAVRFTGRRP